MPLPAIKTRYWMHSGRMHQGLPVLVGAEVLAIDFKAGVVLLRFDDPAYHDCPHVPFRTLYLSAFWAAMIKAGPEEKK